MPRAARKQSTGRGSPEAVEKRRVARQLNTLFSGNQPKGDRLDGRTEKRRLRLLKEIKEGKRGRPLKAIEVVSHANELLGLGESVTSIRRNGVLLPKLDFDPAVEGLEIARRAQAAYSFDPEVWKLLGIDLGVGKAKPSKGKKKATKKRRK